jgi:hypothetical protein
MLTTALAKLLVAWTRFEGPAHRGLVVLGKTRLYLGIMTALAGAGLTGLFLGWVG